MDSSGSLNAQVLLLLAERLRAKAVFQVTHSSCLHPLRHLSLSSMGILPRGSRGRSRGNIEHKKGEGYFISYSPPQTQQAKFLTWQFDGEYRGDDYTATLTLGNPDLIGESGGELGWRSFLPVHLQTMSVMPFHLQCSLGIRKGTFWAGQSGDDWMVKAHT